MKKIVSLMCALAVLIPTALTGVTAEKAPSTIEAIEENQMSENSYSKWLKSDGAASASGKETVLSADEAKKEKAADGLSFYEWQVNADADSAHYIKISYRLSDETRDEIEIAISQDGKYPYKELESVKLEREYRDVSEPTEDYNGNQVRSEQEQSDGTIENYAFDYSYEYSEPLAIRLYKNKTSVLRITELSCKVEIKSVTLIPTGNIKSYKAWLSEQEQSGAAAADETVFVEGEDYSLKSSTTVYPISDSKSVDTTPQKTGKVILNTVGGYHWNTVGQYIKWNVRVEKAGLYRLCMRARQNAAPGQTASRILYVNGEIPFVEAKRLAFRYDTSWQTVMLGDDYYIYLNEGDNEIKLQNTTGEMSAVLRVLNNSIQTFNNIYNTLLPVLGASPDLMRDYRIGKLYPKLVEQMGEQAEVLSVCADWIEDYCGEGNSGAALIRTFVRQLKSMNEDPDTIPKEYSYFKTNIGSLSTWIGEATEQPLEIDSFTFGNDSEKYPKKSSGLSQLWFGIKNYLCSYVTDYEMIGTKERVDEESSLTVWVGAGREQAQIIRSMAAKSFTPNTGIAVTIKNVSASLMTATVAGIGPDLVVNSSPDVFNFAMRKAAYPVSDFDDFEEVSKRFSEASLIPLKYLDKYYALPESISFEMLFYRTDILKQVGVEVPQTWDDLISISSVLSNNNMEIGVSATAESFLLMLKQAGLDIYAEDGKYSVLDSVASINVFDKFTDFFVNYGFPLSYDVVNRFRSGEMPVTVAAIGTYNSLKISAPEINGLWAMTQIPGTVREDGSIDRTGLVTTGASMILADTDKPDEAWEFLKWWTEAEQQISYADEIESVLGASSRYNSANLEAFEQSQWSKSEKEMLLRQIENLTAVEPVPGGYYLSRNVLNAFRNVVYNDMSPTDALYEYTYQINSEIDKKREEFGLELREKGN